MNMYDPSHVTGENNTKFFVARPMSAWCQGREYNGKLFVPSHPTWQTKLQSVFRPVPYHMTEKPTKLFVTRPVSRKSLIYKNVHGPSHVTGENNGELFARTRMRLDKRNYKVFFTSCPIQHNKENYKVVYNPSHVTGGPNLKKYLRPLPCHGREQYKILLSLVPYHGGERFKILCGPSHATVERTIQNYSCQTKLQSVFTSGPISHNRQADKVVCDPSHITGEPNLQRCF